MRLISYRAWEQDLRARGWRDWRYWSLLLVVFAATFVAGGMWPLLVTPAALLIDYAWTCVRMSKLRPPPQ